MSIDELSFDGENEGQGTLTTLGKDGPAGDGGGKSSTIDENGTATVEDSETALEGLTLDETGHGADAGETGTPPDGNDVHAASDDSSFASFEREPRGWDEAHMCAASDDESVASSSSRVCRPRAILPRPHNGRRSRRPCGEQYNPRGTAWCAESTNVARA